MSTDVEIRTKGLDALTKALGELDAERFITLLMRDRFDYTEWRKSQWLDRSVREISRSAADHAARGQ